MNLGRAMAEPLACAVLGMRRLGPVFGDPVVVIGAGTVGLLLQLLLLARGRVLLLSWTGSASGWRSPRKLGAAQAVTDAGALDGARFEVAVDATGCRRRSRPRRAARPWRADGGLRCVASPGRDQRLAVPGL